MCLLTMNYRVGFLPSLMAISQSLASIMEEMMTKVMEDASSTSIIFTQAPTNASAMDKV